MFSKKLVFKCGCGEYNHTFNDWICHWKYGIKYNNFVFNKLNAIKLFLLTRIEWK